MTDAELAQVRAQVRAARERTSFPAPVAGRDNNATADQHAEYGAPQH